MAHIPRIAWVALPWLLSPACGSSSGTSVPPAVPPAVTLDELLAAPEVLDLGGLTLVLDARLARNLTPGVGLSFPRPVFGSVTVTEVDLQAIPEGVDAAWAWLTDGVDLFLLDLEECRDPASAPFELVKRTAGAADLDAGSLLADVVVAIRTEDGELRLLRAADREIKVLF